MRVNSVMDCTVATPAPPLLGRSGDQEFGPSAGDHVGGVVVEVAAPSGILEV